MNASEIKVKLIRAGFENETIFVLGTQGSGKTTLIANLLQNRERFVLFDTKADFPADFFSPPAVECSGWRQMATLLNKGENRIIVKLYEVANQENELEACCDFLLKWHTAQNKGSQNLYTYFALDELNAFCSTAECGDNLRAIMQRGRSVGIKKVFGAQWFNTIPTWARDGFSELFVFRHTDDAGLDKLQSFGFDMQEVRDLPQYTCQHFSKKNGVRTIKLTPEKEQTTEPQKQEEKV